MLLLLPPVDCCFLENTLLTLLLPPLLRCRPLLHCRPMQLRLMLQFGHLRLIVVGHFSLCCADGDTASTVAGLCCWHRRRLIVVFIFHLSTLLLPRLLRCHHLLCCWPTQLQL